MKPSKVYRFFTPIIRLFIKLIYHPKYFNQELIDNLDEGFIIAGNHQSAFDPLILITATKKPLHFFTKIELSKAFFIGYFLKKAGLIFVDRSKKSPESIELGEKYLKAREIVAIYPEGTRNKNYPNDLLPFKMGAFKLAKDMHKKIVIAVITGKIRPIFNNLKMTFKGPYDLEKMTIEEASDFIREEMMKVMGDNK